jgi:hypothetical protein
MTTTPVAAGMVTATMSVILLISASAGALPSRRLCSIP